MHHDAAWHARISRVLSGALRVWDVTGTVSRDPDDPDGFVVAPGTGPAIRVRHHAPAGWSVTVRDPVPGAAAPLGRHAGLPGLLRDPALSRTAVIVNEFGAVGLDRLLVEASDEEIVLLDGGCLCCTVRGDLVCTAGDLLARRAAGTVAPFERIVIETTGLADPAPILQALMTDPALADALRLESVIATVDAAAGAATLDAHPESVKQAAVADRIVVTKSDLSDPAASGLAGRLHALNPTAHQMTAVHGAIDACRLFGGGLYDPSARGPDVRRWLGAETVVHSRHDDAVTCFCLRRSAPLRALTLTLFLQVLAEHCGANLLRLKGLVNVRESPGRPAVIHGVQHVFHPPALARCVAGRRPYDAHCRHRPWPGRALVRGPARRPRRRGGGAGGGGMTAICAAIKRKERE